MGVGMRSANYRTLESYTVPSGGCTKMGLTKIGDTVGFFYETKDAGEEVAVVIQMDAVELAKKAGSGEAIAQGAKVYYETASGKLTGVSGSNTLCGRCTKAALAADTTVLVDFNGDVAA
jgi:predicted RecA/RadA family phage recombinase